MILALCEKRGKFLYEVEPWHFPYPELTDTEILLWAYYNSHRNAIDEAERDRLKTLRGNA